MVECYGALSVACSRKLFSVRNVHYLLGTKRHTDKVRY